MQDLKLSQIINADFRLHEGPVLRPFGGSFVVADPSLLLPDETPDGLWRMFFHTELYFKNVKRSLQGR